MGDPIWTIMNANWKLDSARSRRQRRNWRLLLLLVVVGLGAVISSLFSISEPGSSEHELVAQEKPAAVTPVVPTIALPQGPVIVTRVVAPGDNLSAIFDSVKINQTVLFQILAADESLLALDILRLGNRLTFTLDEKTGELEKMELFIDLAHQIIYRRVDENLFDSEEIILPGVWKNQTVEAEIDGSFYASALAAGLSEQETGNITSLFKGKLDFSRDIQAGDRFQVVRSLQFVDDQATGQSHIEGIRFSTRNHYYSAFLFADGNYYDENGESLAQVFLRYPFKGHHRVSSPFNLRRMHPITGRISPHRGVDFAMPSGTPIMATADGEITRVKNHPFAGKYIEVKHDGQYLTRYLHLSRINVKRGQKVKRGGMIARSGNTGRSTGPHLHYEIHIKRRAVNPLTADIPLMAAVPKERFKEFKQMVVKLYARMEHVNDAHDGT